MNGAELNTILPYNDPRCRAGLYQLLEKLVLCPSPQWPAPLNYASAVLNNGLNDPNLEVIRDLCFVMYSTKLHIGFQFAGIDEMHRSLGVDPVDIATQRADV